MLKPHDKPFFGCACCGNLLGAHTSRRHFLQIAGSAGFVGALTPLSAFAATGNYEAMVLSCIDPRLQEPVRKYLATRTLTGKHSQFVFAGAAIGAVAPAFKDWHKTFWDNLAATIQLHNIKKVIAINHRDCGAAKIAYGAEAVADDETETMTHRKALAIFRKEVSERQPKLAVETALIGLNGKVEMFHDFVFVTEKEIVKESSKESNKDSNKESNKDSKRESNKDSNKEAGKDSNKESDSRSVASKRNSQ
jgi:carbonic anhydrase